MFSTWGNTNRVLAPWGMRVGAGEVGAASFQGSWRFLENSNFQRSVLHQRPTGFLWGELNKHKERQHEELILFKRLNRINSSFPFSKLIYLESDLSGLCSVRTLPAAEFVICLRRSGKNLPLLSDHL